MDFVFLGTGSAWGVPEFGCPCRICQKMLHLKEERRRSAYLLKGPETILIDCGPDIRRQLLDHPVDRIDAVLISHEHADHFFGLDELLAFRRRLPREKWQPIPVFATKASWTSIRKVFGYLLDSLIEPRIAQPGERLSGLETDIYPFKTFHGDSAPGSIGYIVEESISGRLHKLVYTSDFIHLPREEPRLAGPDVLVLQCHWLNEPITNRPHHLSLQRGLEYIRAWNPKDQIYLVHISEAYPVEGDPANDALKKLVPGKPMRDPRTQLPYPMPACQAEWQETVEKILTDQGITTPVAVPTDGQTVRLW